MHLQLQRYQHLQIQRYQHLQIQRYHQTTAAQRSLTHTGFWDANHLSTSVKGTLKHTQNEQGETEVGPGPDQLMNYTALTSSLLSAT